MAIYNVVPHVGIGPLRLGMTQAGVRRAVPEYQVRASLRGGCEEFIPELGLLVDYSAMFGEVMFVEVNSLARSIVMLAGCSAFDTKADNLVAAVVREYGLDPAEFPPGRYDYKFPSLNLVLWRGVLGDDTPESRGWAFEAIAVHKPGYYTSDK